jgi:CelD/BcsL family acetyltransferase involved in cellulose biosynthesis
LESTVRNQRVAAKAVAPAPLALQLDDPRWHSFVGSRRDALSFHHPAWAALVADCYGYRAFAFTLQASDGDIVAGAPVVEVTDPLRRRRWISLPFTDECPLLADSESSVPFGAALRTAGIDEGVKSLELRTRIADGGGAEYLAGVTHELALEADAEAVHRRLHPSQVRRNIRRAEREGVRVQRAERARDVVDTYYALHVRTRRRLGIPPQPRRFFQLLWERMLEPELGFALLAYLDRTPVAGAVFLSWNSRLTYKFGASDAAHWRLRPNHTIFWSAILWGCENGLEMLDFGRSALENAGLRAFKRNWGAEERPIIYTTLLGSAPYTRRAMASRASAGILRRAPLWVCRGVGTALYRYAA